MKCLLGFLLALCIAPASIAATAAKPSLSVKTLDGATFDLSKQSGKWVIVNFWATWCSPCLKELPDISAFVAAHKDKVAAIGLDFEDADKQDVDDFLKKHPLSYPVAQVDIDNPPKDFDAPKGLPNTYVIAPDGHVAKAFLGPITTKDLEAAVGG
jgi:thiol-disulfide isomerase/thioredoxin